MLVNDEKPISQPHLGCCTESNKDTFQNQEDGLALLRKDNSNKSNEITDSSASASIAKQRNIARLPSQVTAKIMLARV